MELTEVIYNSTDIYTTTTERQMLVVGTLFGICGIVGIIGNTATILVTITNPKLRKSKPSWLIASLALSDLLFCAVYIPIPTLALLVFHGYSELGARVCILWTYLGYSNITTSIWTLLLITINRYIAVVHQKWYHKLYSTRSVIAQILLLWFYIYGVLLLPLLGLYGKFVYNGQFCLFAEDDRGINPNNLYQIHNSLAPTLIMIILYAIIFWHVRQSRLELQSFRSERSKGMDRKTVEGNSNRTSTDIKLAKTMGITLFVMIASYAPFSVMNVHGYYQEHIGLSALSYALAYSASATNFIIYAVWHPQYRKAYMGLLRGMVKFASSDSSNS